VRRLHQTSDIRHQTSIKESLGTLPHLPAITLQTQTASALASFHSPIKHLYYIMHLSVLTLLSLAAGTHIAAGSPPTPQAEAWDLPNINTILNTISNQCLLPHRIATCDASDGECSYVTNRKLHPRPPLFRNLCADDKEFAIRPRMSLTRSCLLPSLTPYIAAIPQTTPAKYVHAISTSPSLQN
jgi:hypothetical protein